jgi:hypothetical protein
LVHKIPRLNHSFPRPRAPRRLPTTCPTFPPNFRRLSPIDVIPFFARASAAVAALYERRSL